MTYSINTYKHIKEIKLPTLKEIKLPTLKDLKDGNAYLKPIILRNENITKF